MSLIFWDRLWSVQISYVKSLFSHSQWITFLATNIIITEIEREIERKIKVTKEMKNRKKPPNNEKLAWNQILEYLLIGTETWEGSNAFRETSWMLLIWVFQKAVITASNDDRSGESFARQTC